ncbi:protein FAM161B [Trichomycterus rosablanca]|uniref:protein FAM161B n=1 Tax=Trichomycterus rosablanca TaxID=2290929 RepID=UPI002F35D359
MTPTKKLDSLLENREIPDILLELRLDALKTSHQQHLKQIEQQHQADLESRILENSLLTTSTDAPLKTNEEWQNGYREENTFKSRGSAYLFTRPQKSSSTPNLSSKISQAKTSSTLRAATSKSHDTWKRTNPELKDSKLIKEELDWAECQKQFHASPVPEHVFKTLYNDILQKQELTSLEGRQQRKELLLSMQKPFTTHQKEDRRMNETKPETNPKNQSRNRNLAGKRRAIPKAVTDSKISEKLKEEEQQRKIRIQMRAQETLKASSAPIQSQCTRANLQANTAQITKSKLLGFLQQTPSFQPKINTKVPDFNKLYQGFQKEVMERGERKEVTVCQPFQLLTSTLRQRNSRSSLDKSTKATSIDSLKRSNSFGGLTSLSRDTLPTYITDAARKRSIAIRKSMELRDNKEQESTEWMKQHRLNSQAISRGVAARSKAMDPHKSLKEVFQEKLKQHRQADEERMNDYKKELREMKTRVTTRPYLFEQVSQKIAKCDAERRYKNTLEQAGLDEHFVRSKGENDKSPQTSKQEDGDDHSSETDSSQREGSEKDCALSEERTEEDGMKTKEEEVS